MKSLVAPFVLGTLLTVSVPASAQETFEGQPLPKGNSLAEVQERQAANAEQAKLAQEQLDQNAASQAAHDQAMKDYQSRLARIAQQQADAERAHAAAMDKWKADVAACQAGDTARCAGGANSQ